MKKRELQKEYDRLKRLELQREIEETKEYNLFCWWSEWIYIIECVWKKMKRIKQYKLKWYDIYRNAVFWLEMEWRPTEDYFNS